MRWVWIVRHRIHSLLRRSRAEADLQREIDLHLEQLTNEYIATGMTDSEARLSARRQFGPVEMTKEQCRDTRRVNLIEDMITDVTYAFRWLRKSRGFTLTAVLSLALGIGANTVVFSVLNALVLKPLPIPEPARVYFVNNSGQPANSFPNYREIRDRNGVFDSLFSYRITQMALDDSSGAHRIWGYLVTGNYFETLGITPALGRFFTPAEDAHPNSSPYAVLSYTCWQHRFGSDPDMVGKNVLLNGYAYTVVGVAPHGFHGTEVFFWPDVWVPMTMQPQIEGHSWLENANTFNAWIAGRLKAGVSVDQADANLKVLAGHLAREHAVNEGMQLTLSPLGIGGSMGRKPTRAFASGVMLLALLVLLAACANLAALLTARAADRERELAIRVSMGAGRGRIVRQLLTESLSISVAGGAMSYCMAVVLLQMLSRWRAPLEFPVRFDVNPDWRVLLFALTAAVGTGVLFGVGPARRAWKAEPALSVKGLAVPVCYRRWAGRDVLLPLQIALCCVLVMSSLVAVRGLMHALRTPLGFNPDGLAVVAYGVGFAGYDEPRGRVFEQRALEEVSRLPGVESVAYADSVPLRVDTQSTTTVNPENTTGASRKPQDYESSYYDVSARYFLTAGTRLLAGRDFTLQDQLKSPRVAIVNRTFARRVVNTTDAVGRRFRRGSEVIEIVGVVEDGKYETLTETTKPALFLPILQNYSPTIILMARSHRPESDVAAEMRQTIARLDSHVPIYAVGGLHQMLGFVYLPMHAAVITLGAFGLLALMLSITGIYGLSAYSVSRRAKEIGIRMAIGARPAQVLRSVFGRLGMLVTAGALIGLVLGVAGARVLASIVYQASSHDPLVIVSAVLLLTVVALAAAFGPARRAVTLDPVQSLRHE